MDGKHSYDPEEYPYDEFRTYRLCTLLHCKPSELDDESAIELDWLLEVDNVVAEFKAEQQKKAWKQSHG